MPIKLSPEQQRLLLGLLAALLVGLAVTVCRGYFISQPDDLVMTEPRHQTAVITVQISGAVNREGVYRLLPGDKLMDLVSLAGGVLSNADLTALDLNKALNDREKLVIPTVKFEPVEHAATSQVNLNTATIDELDALPGIGRSTASKIVELRQTKGPFSKLDQLLEIPRLGKSRLDKIKKLIII